MGLSTGVPMFAFTSFATVAFPLRSVRNRSVLSTSYYFFIFFFSIRYYTPDRNTDDSSVRWKIATLKPCSSDALRFRVFSRCFSSANRRRRTRRITRIAGRIAYGRHRLSRSIWTKVSYDCRWFCIRFEGIGKTTRMTWYDRGFENRFEFIAKSAWKRLSLLLRRPWNVCSVGARLVLNPPPLPLYYANIFL